MKGPKSRLRTAFKSSLRSELKHELGLSSVMEVPELLKIVMNVGVGEGKDNPKAVESALKTLTIISGQKPVVTRARRSIANFKLRAGNPVGVAVTLRGEMMWHFFDKLVNIVLPRVRDFQGTSVADFDGHGNFNLGFRDQLVFPEIVYDEIESLKGLSVAVVTTAKDDAQGAHLLHKLGMPFRDYTRVETVGEVVSG